MPLIYHTKESNSVFEENIFKVLKNDNIKITCPYVNLDIFKSWVGSKNNWKFITDLDELLSGLGNNMARIKFLDFYKNNIANIRHIPNLHAKCVISSKNILFGSANFTETGLTKRTEISYYAENKDEVEELNNWFDDNWNQAGSGSYIDEVEVKINKLNI